VRFSESCRLAASTIPIFIEFTFQRAAECPLVGPASSNRIKLGPMTAMSRDDGDTGDLD